MKLLRRESADSGWSVRADKSEASASAQALAKSVASSSSQIWKSRLSWRLALAVFLTIMTVQTVVMAVTVRNYEQARLNELGESGRSAIVPMLQEKLTGDISRVSPLEAEEGQRLITTTRISGLALYYEPTGQMLDKYGTTTLTISDPQKIPVNYRSPDGGFYDVVFRPRELAGRPYLIVMHLDASNIKGQVKEYVEQAIVIMLMMSLFVTTVLMIALGHWLLEPILFLRDNLQRAAENPENPKIKESPYDLTDEIGGAIGMAQTLIRQNADNISRIKTAAENQIHKLAYYDTLTGLPNRTLFLQNLNEQARKATADKNGARLAVIAMDLDHFKDINDSMGHSIGDALLRSVGKRLRASLPESAVVARVDADEFAITMPLSLDAITARDIAERVAGVIRAEPFRIFNENFQIRTSIGVATYPDDGDDPDHVLKNADIALNRAKEDGRDTIKEYSEDFDRAVQQRFQMLRDLRDAMEQKQLLLHYQPQLDLNSGKIIGAESLLRWWKPDSSKEGGYFIPPGDFVPIAEQSGLIVPIGEMVLLDACQKAAAWAKAGHDIRIAVNVSGAQFYQSDIVAYVQKCLAETGLQAHRLELEVTESVFMEDVNHAIQTLQNLHGLGCELAIDDFGTGYSSLSYLRQFPIDRLKIDQSFIRNALNNPDDAAIARTIVRLGHSLNLKVIAEGVETKDHEAFLMEEGCDEVQGYRYSRPISAEKFSAFLENYKGDMSAFD